MIEITILYYVVCLMFCLGYGVHDRYLNDCSLFEHAKTIIGCFFVAPFLPLIIGMRISSVDSSN